MTTGFQMQLDEIAGGTQGAGTRSSGDGPVLGLDEEAARDPNRAGNKAARLAELTQLGFRVPAGFALDASWCERIGSTPDAIESGVRAAVRHLGDGPFAVRSSGIAEDGHAEAMAGRYRTELNVAADDVAGAVVRCVQAARDADERDGREHEPVAILVQEMVDADVAGVAFSKNPVTGDDVPVVSAVEGLGDRLVSGLATGEDWCVEDGVPTRASADRGVMRKEQVREIAVELERIAEGFGEPQDVEWAWKDDDLFILQARPITALPVPPPDEPIPEGTWIKDETHYPNGLTPLAGSVYAPALEDAMEHAFGRWGLMIAKVEQLIHKHEAYGKPVPAGGGGDGAPPPAFLLGVLSRIVPPIRKLAKKARVALESGLGDRLIQQWETEDRTRIERLVRELRETPTEGMSDAELVAHFDECVAALREGQRIHFLLFIPYATALYDLHHFVEDALGWDVHQTLELLVGLSEETSGPARALRELAAVASEEVVEVLGEARVSDDRLAATLAEADPGFARRWSEFVERWGHRTMGYDLGQPTLAERPGVIRRRLVETIERDDSRLDTLGARREAAEHDARERLPTSATEEFERLLAKARRHWPNREENVAYTDAMTNAVVRYAGLAIGRRLTGRGQLDRPTDMAMLSREELLGALDEDRDFRPVVRRRRAERAWVQAHPGPAALGGDEQPMPDLRYCPEAIRRTSGALIWMMGFEYFGDEVDDGDAINGLPGAPGKATGTVRIVNGPEDFHRVRAGDVLVCPTTTPAWTIVFGALCGIVAEGGGALAHAAIAAREHHLPAVLGVPNARKRLQDGATVEVDGTNGKVRVIE